MPTEFPCCFYLIWKAPKIKALYFIFLWNICEIFFVKYSHLCILLCTFIFLQNIYLKVEFLAWRVYILKYYWYSGLALTVPTQICLSLTLNACPHFPICLAYRYKISKVVSVRWKMLILRCLNLNLWLLLRPTSLCTYQPFILCYAGNFLHILGPFLWVLSFF